jgi:hypothetical protein
MQVTEEGRIKLVESADERGGLGGIGLFGSTPSGSVPTQTNRDGTTGDDTTTQAASDGGTATADGDAEFVDAVSVRGQPDQYCGNCEQFSYVRTDDGIAPYCGYHGEYMDDMDACEEWEPNY